MKRKTFYNATDGQVNEFLSSVIVEEIFFEVDRQGYMRAEITVIFYKD